MGLLNWFSGGTDRSAEAIKLIAALLNALGTDAQNAPLLVVLNKYEHELIKQESAVPFILSRMNISIANAIRSNQMTLNAKQTEKLNQLQALSNTRYGY